MGGSMRLNHFQGDDFAMRMMRRAATAKAQGKQMFPELIKKSIDSDGKTHFAVKGIKVDKDMKTVSNDTIRQNFSPEISHLSIRDGDQLEK